MTLSVAATLVLTDRDPGHTATSVITVAAALAVAVLTVITTDRRQDKQLAHDADGQQRQLDHVLRMRVREEQIELVEEAAATAYKAGDAFDHLIASWAAGLPSDADSVVNERKTVERALVALNSLHLRLGMRLGVGHPAREAFAEISAAHRALLRLTEEYWKGRPHADVKTKLDAAAEAVTHAEMKFVATAHREVERLGESAPTAVAKSRL